MDALRIGISLEIKPLISSASIAAFFSALTLSSSSFDLFADS